MTDRPLTSGHFLGLADLVDLVDHDEREFRDDGAVQNHRRTGQ